jgi:sugar lactone lactonase YvrE
VVALTGGGPYGVAFDTSGNLYTTAYNNGAVYKWTPIGGTITAASTGSTFASGFGNVAQMAFDSSGNLYVGDVSSNVIRKITPSRVVTNFATVSSPAGLAFDTSGNLYATDQNANTISKITPAGVVSTFVSASAGLTNPYALTIDSAGNRPCLRPVNGPPARFGNPRWYVILPWADGRFAIDPLDSRSFDVGDWEDATAAIADPRTRVRRILQITHASIGSLLPSTPRSCG